MRWSDVDLDAGTAVLARSLSDVGNVLIEGDTRNHRSRPIGLNDNLVRLLRRHRIAQNEWRLQVGPDWIDRVLVFRGPGGDFLKPATLSQRFDRLIARIDVPRIRVHDLRHTYATLQVEVGGAGNAKTVSQQLGHADVTFTMNRYVKPSIQSQIDAANRFARRLGRGTR
jgi:integrase